MHIVKTRVSCEERRKNVKMKNSGRTSSHQSSRALFSTLPTRKHHFRHSAGFEHIKKRTCVNHCCSPFLRHSLNENVVLKIRANGETTACRRRTWKTCIWLVWEGGRRALKNDRFARGVSEFQSKSSRYGGGGGFDDAK